MPPPIRNETASRNSHVWTAGRLFYAISPDSTLAGQLAGKRIGDVFLASAPLQIGVGGHLEVEPGTLHQAVVLQVILPIRFAIEMQGINVAVFRPVSSGLDNCFICSIVSSKEAVAERSPALAATSIE